jgi:hypothetical protein
LTHFKPFFKIVRNFRKGFFIYKEEHMNNNIDLSVLERELPAIIFRDKTSSLVPGVNPRTLANMDANGEGPVGRFRIGRKVVYNRDSFISWLKGRATQCTKK